MDLYVYTQPSTIRDPHMWDNALYLIYPYLV
jgi:hypothetical protein